ncbi:MAG: hypothetical protein SFU27_01005 [Thermonemataceae bacterium]|nr:hypothetical protein [Thermonemataceae bacterium]
MNKKIRETYADASKSAAKLKELELLLQKENPEAASTKAYLGAVAALKGNFSFFPAMKLSYFWEASRYFEEAIRQEPNNLEAIFLRFTVECGVPAIMSYALHLQEDKKQIITLLKSQEVESYFKKAIIKFLTESGKCTLAEKKELQGM